MISKFYFYGLFCSIISFVFVSRLSSEHNYSSAFVPDLHSGVSSSFLAQNPIYDDFTFQVEDNGLSYPFSSISIFKEAFVDVFTNTNAPKHNLFSYRHPSLSADFNIYAGIDTDFTKQGDYHFWYKGWKLHAQAAKYFYLRTDWFNGAFYGNLDTAESDELIDGYYKRFENNHIQHDNLNGEIAYRNNNVQIALGRGRVQIGNNISGSIILSDNVNDYAYLLGEAQVGDFRLSMIHGSLMADSSNIAEPESAYESHSYPDKYIALHQLTWFPTKGIELFLGESVVYGNRGLDLNYLLPNGFWRAAEHNLYDRDNVMIFAGTNLRMPGGTLLYGQFALDEFSYSKFFTNWWGNKYALQAGLSRAIPSGKLSLEATAVRPYTYAHYTNHTMYSHDGRPLGYPQGSNVLDISMETNLAFRNYLKLDSRLSWRRKGSKGASWQDNYHDIFSGEIDSASAFWFEGKKSNEFQICSSITIPIMAHHKFLIGHDSSYNEDWQHKLFGAWQFIY
ncbi:MAG: hypothetical protein PHY41_06700 [Candidatus Cloacimonetes bacterium]|nr:hypothetical protein [Candidatus Cloacimonadota bacterium]